MEATARQVSWGKFGLSHHDNETPEMRAERKRLEQRITEEAGPVTTFWAVEELVPKQGRRGAEGLSLRKHGLYLLTGITRQLDVPVRKVRLTYDHVRKILTIMVDPDGLWTITYSKSCPGQKHPLGKFGAANVRQMLLGAGITEGTYHAEVLDEGTRIVVDFNRRIG